MADIELGSIGSPQNEPAEIEVVSGDQQPEESLTGPEADARTRITFVKAILGELLCTTLFIFVNLANALNFERAKGDAQIVNPVVGALCVGFSSVALIYSFADVSGANFNPAVTFATIVTRKTTPLKGLCYIAAQLTGATLACFLLWIIFPSVKGQNPISLIALTRPEDVSLGGMFLMEFLLSYILVYVIFATAFDTIKPASSKESGTGRPGQRKKLTIYTTSGNTKAGFAPIAIGFTLGFLAFIGGSISGGAFNPARAFGPALLSGIWDNQWLYWIADFLGAGLAGSTQLFFGARTTMLCPPTGQ
jgi:aquaporin related protein